MRGVARVKANHKHSTEGVNVPDVGQKRCVALTERERERERQERMVFQKCSFSEEVLLSLC